MTKKNVSPNTVDKDNIINADDVECASDCNKDWQVCLKANPEKEGTCHLKLATCVKECDS